MPEKLTGKTSSIDAIVALMRANWDLPTDCNNGELYTYAEHLRDRIWAGDDAGALEDYLKTIQTDKFDMPESIAYRVIVKGAAAITGTSIAKSSLPPESTTILDEAALPEMPTSEAEKYDGSPV